MVGRGCRIAACVWVGWFSALPARAGEQPFQFPTANHALFEPGGGSRFFVGTVGKPWTSGCFGCVRSEGWQMHEGLDIRCLRRDRRGEPVDPVLAAADGTVVYVNTRPSLSNYGNYIVLRHKVDGLEVYTLYAHLRQAGVKPGQPVQAGDRIGVMGRTANTREPISLERAHVHFEIDLLVNDRFAEWFKKVNPRQRNDHGEWNGQNLLGLDPQKILLEEHEQGARFNLLEFIRSENELCRVQVRKTGFPWLKRYPALVRPNPTAAREGVAGYELALDFNGIPIEMIPRAASELKSKAKFHLVSVNEAEYRKNPCRKLVIQRGTHWQFGRRGIDLLDLLTY
jgi:murein DD-endopeptidase MepM/ murein hydrolase activator NlpD